MKIPDFAESSRMPGAARLPLLTGVALAGTAAWLAAVAEFDALELLRYGGAVAVFALARRVAACSDCAASSAGRHAVTRSGRRLSNT